MRRGLLILFIFLLYIIYRVGIFAVIRRYSLIRGACILLYAMHTRAHMRDLIQQNNASTGMVPDAGATLSVRLRGDQPVCLAVGGIDPPLCAPVKNFDDAIVLYVECFLRSDHQAHKRPC